jgi:TolB-like protein/DNA-binding winged helix-turn-helix (wHTH) protein/cytochrome c-type biogenesis protein CcmH/NrfG
MRDAPGSGRLEQLREAPSLLRFADFILDLDARTLVRETGGTVALTRGEFALLRVFVTRPGRVLSRDAVLDALANRRFEPFDRSVDVMVGKLRRKIELDSKQPRLIVTVPGEGYRFDGLAKGPLIGQGLTMAVPSSVNGASPREDALSDPRPERRAERDLLEAEAKPVSGAAIDQTKAWASKLGGLFLLWPAVAAVFFLAAASSWFVFAGKGAKTTEAARLSIVVLPFVNLSGDPAQDYLVDALTDELTTSLARMSGTISGVFVIARNTAMTYKGKPVDARAIGRDLGVRYVLEGSVQPSGNQVRVNARLIDADSGAHLWAEQFDTPRADLLQTQDEIVTVLARAMEIQLPQAEAARAKRTRAANPDAEDLALQGFAAVVKGGYLGKEADAGYALCEQALRVDPNNVRALWVLSMKFHLPVLFGISADPKADLKRADELVSQALALDPANAAAHNSKAWVLHDQGRLEEAIAERERTLALDPADLNAMMSMAWDHLGLGQYEKGLEIFDEAIRLSPRSPELKDMYTGKSWAYFALKHYDQAIDWGRQAIAAGPSNPGPYKALSAALALTGHEAEAREALQHYLALPSGTRAGTIAALMAYNARSQQSDPRVLDTYERLYEGLRKAGLPEGEAQTH